MFIIACCGLVFNIIQISILHTGELAEIGHGHSHGGDSHGHSHSHGDEDEGHSHGDEEHGHSHGENGHNHENDNQNNDANKTEYEQPLN